MSVVFLTTALFFIWGGVTSLNDVLIPTLAGNAAGSALIAVGLFNSIMFPTVFALALEGLGAKMAEGAGLLCVAIVGGAIVPLAAGKLADATSIGTSLAIPLACYAVVAVFGLLAPSRE